MPKHRYSGGTTPDEVVKELAPTNGYRMHLKSQNDWGAVAKAVNIGIDAHLEAFTESTFDGNTGRVWIAPGELHILVRRLQQVSETAYPDWNYDQESNPAEELRSAILETLDIEEV